MSQNKPSSSANLEQCWFCENAAADKEAAATVEMHAGGFLGGGREYQVIDTATLSVPRCRTCKSVHDHVEGRVAKGGIIGLLIGIVAALLTLNQIGYDSVLDFWRTLLIEVAVFGMIGGVAAWLMARFSIPKGVKDQRTREQYPAIRQKIKEGWTVGPKPPGL
jgi:hypothetical protein